MRILGHRGAAGIVVENTLAGVARALADGADGVEVDVRATADGVLVLSHDPTLARLGGPAAPVAALTWSELATVRLGGEPVATVADLLDLVAGADVVLEVKNVPGEPDFDAPVERTARLLDELLQARRPARGVVVSSFDWYAIEAVSAVPTAFLSPPGLGLRAAVAYTAEAGHAECHPHWSSVLEDPGAVSTATAAGVRVVAWTVDDPAVARSLAAAGVDAVISNDPGALRAAYTTTESARGSDR